MPQKKRNIYFYIKKNVKYNKKATTTISCISFSTLLLLCIGLRSSIPIFCSVLLYIFFPFYNTTMNLPHVQMHTISFFCVLFFYFSILLCLFLVQKLVFENFEPRSVHKILFQFFYSYKKLLQSFKKKSCCFFSYNLSSGFCLQMAL